MKKRLISLALALFLALSLAPTALAAEGKISRLPIDERPEAPESKDFSQYVTGKLLTKEELTLNGVPFYEYTYSEAKALLPFKAPSAPSLREPEEGEQEQYYTWKHNPTANSSVTHYVGSDDLVNLGYTCCDTWDTEEFTVIDTGVRGIKTGDSLESVLQALGISAEGAPIIAAEMMDNHTNFELWGEDTKHGITWGSSYEHHHNVGTNKCLDAPRITWRGPDGIQLELDFFLGRLGDITMSDTTKIPDRIFTDVPAEPEEPETPNPATPSFTDLPDWCETEAQWAADNGITVGTGNNKFSPGTNCTQEQILTFLWRAKNKPTATAKAPVTVDAAYADAVNWAYGEGMIDASFNPKAPCTRADAVTYIWQSMDSPKTEIGSSFTDLSASADCAGAVAWAVASKITNGYANGDGTFSFRPDNVCRRGEIACFLYRAYRAVPG